MLNFFGFTVLIYASVELLTFLFALAYEVFDSFLFLDFDWETIGETTGTMALIMLPFFALVNLIKFFTIAYGWFF